MRLNSLLNSTPKTKKKVQAVPHKKPVKGKDTKQSPNQLEYVQTSTSSFITSRKDLVSGNQTFTAPSLTIPNKNTMDGDADEYMVIHKEPQSL